MFEPSVSLSPITETAFPPMVTGRLIGMSTWLPPPMLPEPSVITSPMPPVEPPVVVASSEWLSPMPETAFPPTVRGSATGARTWLPPPIESVPSVTMSPAPVPVVDPPVVSAFSVVLSPTPETAFPPTVIGRPMGAKTWLPPAALSLPSVVTSPAPEPEPVDPPVVPASSVVLSPTPETAFPPTTTGSSTGVRIWLPPPIESVPSVTTSPEPEPEPVDPPVTPASEVVLSPTPETAFPPIVTGSSIGARTWLPPPIESVPSVVVSPVLAPSVVPPPVVVASSEWLSPTTDTALPPTVTGASTGRPTWLPPSTLSVPSVVVSPALEPESEPPDVLASSLWLSPTTETALPPTVTGTSTGTMA